MIVIGDSKNPHERLRELVLNLQYLDTLSIGDTCILESIGFVTPFSILPIAAIIQNKNLEVEYGSGVSSRSISYLNTINFPLGCSNSNSSVHWSYIPITCDELPDDTTLRTEKLEQIANLYAELLEKRLIIEDQAFIGLLGKNLVRAHTIGEIVDNISEHSNAKRVLMFSQYYQRDDFIEVCILDTGRGILKSLTDAGISIDTTPNAIKSIRERGLSSKQDANRGMGIRTVHNCVVNEDLFGDYCILSYDGAYVSSHQFAEQYYELSSTQFHGTLIVLKIHKPSDKFDAYKYVN